MQSKYGFTLMTIDEFESWIKSQSVSRTIRLIQLHHTWSPAYKDFKGDHFATQKGMKDYHVNGAGYADIAQQFTTFPDGKICTGRPMNKAPAGIYGANTNGICIENVGDFDAGGDTMTAEQKDTIIRMVAALLKKFGLNASTGVTMHAWWTDDGTSLGDYVPSRSCKTCPGTHFMNLTNGNTKAVYNASIKPLIEAAMNGTYTKEDDEVVEKIKIFNLANKKTYDVDAIQKDGTNYVKLRDLASAFNCLVSYDEAKDLPAFDNMPVNDVNITMNNDTAILRGVFRQNGTNYIAIRDVLENIFGVPHDDILWDEATKTITVKGRLAFQYFPENEG